MIQNTGLYRSGTTGGTVRAPIVKATRRARTTSLTFRTSP
jgi:hypothetical protein